MRDKAYPECMQCHMPLSLEMTKHAFGSKFAKQMEHKCRKALAERYRAMIGDVSDVQCRIRDARATQGDVVMKLSELDGAIEEQRRQLAALENQRAQLREQDKLLDKHINKLYTCPDDALNLGDAKPCPSCSVPISRAGGCDQMFCTVCKTKFNWKTRALISNDAAYENEHYSEYREGARDRILRGEFSLEYFPWIMQEITVRRRTPEAEQTIRIKQYCVELHYEGTAKARSKFDLASLRRDCIDGNVPDFEERVWGGHNDVRRNHAEAKIIMRFLERMLESFTAAKWHNMGAQQAACKKIIQTFERGLATLNKESGAMYVLKGPHSFFDPAWRKK